MIPSSTVEFRSPHFRNILMRVRGIWASRTAALWLLSFLVAGSLCAQTNVYTGRADVSRDGLYPNETYLSSTNVNSSLFGNLFSYPVDGYVSAQPLYVAGVNINGTNHNVVYAATEHESVYAFDADNPGSLTPLWHDSLIPSGWAGSVSSTMTGCTGTNGFTEVGILGTPVIDPSNDTMYVVAKEWLGKSDTTSFWLYGLNIATGAVVAGPTEIEATVNSINGPISFSPLPQLQRPALLLSNGTIFIAFGSNGCDLHDHGWLMAYNETTLQQVENGVFIDSPDVPAGDAIWMSGSGPALDSNGFIYLVTANGDFDVNTGGSDYGDSVVKLQFNSNGLSEDDYFTPYDQLTMEDDDLDLGSGGVMILPPQSGGTFPDLVIAAGKTGTIYVINQEDLGQYDVDGNNNNDQIPQYIPDALGQEYGTASLWNNTVYFSAHSDFLKAFSLTNGVLSTTPVGQSPTSYPVDGVPAISANGTTSGTGIVWVVRQTQGFGETLDAYNATPAAGVLNELYDTSQNSKRDKIGSIGHFAMPIISNGKVYLGTETQLMVFGLLPSLTATAGNSQSGTVATTLPVALTVTATDGYLHQPVSGVAVAFSTTGNKGSFNPPTATTNSSGIATTQYTLPTTAGSITINATNLNSIAGSFSETATAGAPAALSDISGGYQTATVGTTLPAPLLVKLKDTYGNVVPGIPVAFTDNGAGGTFTPPSPVTTDSTGTATVSYTVPTKPKSITITPSYGTLAGKFSEKSTAGAVAAVVVISGNNQSGTQGTQLANPLVAGVTDQYGNALSGVTVTFSDGGAGGTFSTTTPVTNSQGQASVTYTLPNVAEGVNITATVGSFVANFTETSNAPKRR